MRNTILIALVSLVIFSCKKDTFTTTPILKYKSVNTNVLSQGGIIKFKLSFTDAEGDLDSIYIEKVNPNCIKSGTKERFYLTEDIVKLKSKSDELLVSFGYRVTGYPNIGEPKCDFNDTCYFRFALIDKAKNKSDTVKSETFVIIKQ